MFQNSLTLLQYEKTHHNASQEKGAAIDALFDVGILLKHLAIVILLIKFNPFAQKVDHANEG